MDVRLALLTLLLLRCRILKADVDPEEEISYLQEEGFDEWMQCSKDDADCLEAQSFLKESVEISKLYEYWQSASAFLGHLEGRDLTPTEQMMKAVYLEAKLNFPLVLHFDLVLALKKRGIQLGEQLHEPSDAARMVATQAQLLRTRALLGVVLEMLRSERFPISLVFDFYRDRSGRLHCFFIFQYVFGSRKTAMFWKTRTFAQTTSGHEVYKAFVDGLLEDEAYFNKHMSLVVDLPALFAKNLVAVSVGGASSLTKAEKEELMDGAMGIVFLLDTFRQRNDTSRTTIVNLRCSPERRAGSRNALSENLQEKEDEEKDVHCGMLKSHRNALDAFASWRLRSLQPVTDDDLQRVVNASILFGFSTEAAIAAADSYRDFLAALHSTRFTKTFVTEKDSSEMWSDILENLTPLGVSDELALLVRHFLAVPFNGTYVQLAHALLREMEREQVVPLKSDVIEALLTVQINGPSLGLFDPRLHAELWFANGNIAADDEGSEPSEKMQMALGRIPRGDTNVDAFSDISELHGGDDDEEWKAPIARKRRDFDVEKFLDKYDYFFQ